MPLARASSPGAVLFVAAALGGTLFFASLGRLWPLVPAELTVSPAPLDETARELLGSLGFDLAGYQSARRLVVDVAALDYVDRTFGRARTEEWLREGLPLVRYRVYLKKPGESEIYAVAVAPRGHVLGWIKLVDEDKPGARLSEAEARALAGRALEGRLDLTGFEEKSHSETDGIAHRTHGFGYERVHSVTPELRERINVVVTGDEVTEATRAVVVPEAARREARAREARGVALETAGFVLVALAAGAGLLVCLGGIRDGSVRLARTAVWPLVVLGCTTVTFMLQTADVFAAWEPLWPPWVSAFRYFVESAAGQFWVVLLLFALIGAGDRLDAQIGGGRGAALTALARGRLFDPAVALASGRGFLVGLVCGGVMAAAVLVLGATVGSATALQPRGFFFYTLNSASPAAASLLFFFGVALAEELGYRYFGASWLLSLGRGHALAILVPALLYGLTHTRMDFLPPVGPVWARPLVLTSVGAVWGWAFLRYDALTVVLSHFTADLFIFNWPRLASGKPGVVAVSILVVAVPLLPAIGGALARLGRRAPARA